jgi:glycosyltransferase involved in cell wall biosynthesis
MGLVSIIIPVTHRVNRLVLQTRQLETLASEVTGHDFEFIFVDDGSHQECLQVLKDKAQRDKRYRIISLTRDFGPTASFLAGITYASGDCAGFFSGRNLDPSKVFGELIHHWESSSKIVFGKWANPIPKSRSTLYSENLFRRTIFPNRIYFQDISSLLIDKEVYYVLSQITDPFSDIIEILAWTGIKPHMVDYSMQAKEGEEKLLTFRDQEISLEYSEGIYSPKTFRTSFSIGLFFAILGAFATIGLIFVSEYNQQFVPDWWILTSAIVFIFGVQLGMMGVFGEQLFRSLEKIRSRPVFVIDSIINPPLSPTTEGRERIEKMILSLWSIRKQRIAYASSTSALSSEDEVEK